MHEHPICSDCGMDLTGETVNAFEGELLCNDCFRRIVVQCESCGDLIRREDDCGDSCISLCATCRDRDYTTCTECGQLLAYHSAQYDDNEGENPYCESCYQRVVQGTIQSYNYKPEPLFYGSGPLFMGVELEIDDGGETDEHAKVLLGIANQQTERLYAKRDGSIDEGFELVSHPMSLAYHQRDMPWLDIFEKAKELGYRSHQTKTCGLHIHVNRNAFGKTYEEQEEVIARIVFFVEQHWDKLLTFSRRTLASINRWASRYGVSKTAKDTYKNAKNKHMGRYVAVNLENYITIEFRLFRGTLRYTTFMAALQLIEEICSLAIRLSDRKLEQMSWQDFVAQIPPEKTELTAYLKEKCLYAVKGADA